MNQKKGRLQKAKTMNQLRRHLQRGRLRLGGGGLQLSGSFHGQRRCRAGRRRQESGKGWLVQGGECPRLPQAWHHGASGSPACRLLIWTVQPRASAAPGLTAAWSDKEKSGPERGSRAFSYYDSMWAAAPDRSILQSATVAVIY